MVDNISSNSGDICGNDFEDKSLLKLYLTPKSMYSQNDSKSEKPEIEKPITRKIEQLTYLDLRKCEDDELKYFISFPLKYNGTIYQCPSFSKLSLRDQVKVLCSYHSKIIKNISNQAKLQLECVPLPKLIKTSVNSPSYTLNDIEMDVDDKEIGDNNNIDPFDALVQSSSSEYISKSGRITKRKFYSEDNYTEIKKHKVQDNDWINTKIKSPTKSSIRGKKQPLEEPDDTNLVNKTISKANAEIISKSKLFKEIESLKSPRVAKMMKSLEQQNLKVKENEMKLESFNKSLSVDEGTSEYIEESDNSTIRRRVKPPPVKPKVGKLKKQKEPYSELEISTQKAHIEKSVTPSKRSSETLMNNVAACTSTSAQKSTSNMIQCPICSRDFIHTEIEEHASSCGENRVETRSNDVTKSCRFCDEVFLVDKDYEDHIKSCSKRSFK